MKKEPEKNVDPNQTTVVYNNKISGVVGIIPLLFYFGSGAIAHLLIMGSSIDWNNAWTYAIFLGWPLLFFVGMISLVLAGALIAFAVVGCLYLYEWIQLQRYKRNQKNS